MTNDSDQSAGLSRRRSQGRDHQPHPQLFSHRADRRRTGGGDAVADLVVRHLGGQFGAAAHSGGVPAGDLSAGQNSGPRPDHRLRGAHAARLPHRQSDRQQARRFRREPVEPHADRAADLPHHQADFPDAVLQLGVELPPGRPGRVPGAGHVVAGVSDAVAERRKFPRTCRRPSMSRPSCRARRTRPPASSFTCRGAT